MVKGKRNVTITLSLSPLSFPLTSPKKQQLLNEKYCDVIHINETLLKHSRYRVLNRTKFKLISYVSFD